VCVGRGTKIYVLVLPAGGVFENSTCLTVDAMEVLIKYCMDSFPQVDQFIRIQISF
jgi:hypothetical protein